MRRNRPTPPLPTRARTLAIVIPPPAALMNGTKALPVINPPLLINKLPEAKVVRGLKAAEPGVAKELPALETKGAFDDSPPEITEPPTAREPLLQPDGMLLDGSLFTKWTIAG